MFRLFGVEALLGFQQRTDGIIQHQGAVGQSLPAGAIQPGNKAAVFIEVYIIRICEHQNVPDLPAGIVADVHGGAYRQHGAALALTGIGIGRQLGVPEGIHNAVIAHPIPGAEVPVGGVVKHAPAEASGVLPVRHGIVQHPHVPLGLLLPPLPGIEGLGGEHVAVVLRNQQSLALIRGDYLFRPAPWVGAGVGEVVEGVHVLQQAALFQIPDTGGGAAGIQLMGYGVGHPVEGVVVRAFVDPHAPQNDGGMIPVLENHFPGVLHRLSLPVAVADVLPAGNFREHQQTQPIALVQEVVALGIVGGAHGVAGQLPLQNPGILPLEAFRSGVAHVGPALVSVQPPQEGAPAVQVKAVGLEFHHPEAHLLLPHVHDLADFQQGHPAGIEHRVLRIPRPDSGALDGDDAVGGEGLAHQTPFAPQQLHQQQTALGVVELGTDFQGG